MTTTQPELDRLPARFRDGFAELAASLQEFAGTNLLGLVAFGGALNEDLYTAQEPAQSVAVFERDDLDVLVRLARRGAQLGRRRISAPLAMTPAYIHASLDSFPLELLEIQQQHVRVLGQDYFDDLPFDRRHVRLQCERELKRELIHLRRGLLAAGGRHALLYDVCQECAARTLRILRGLLFLKRLGAPRSVPELVESAAAAAQIKLDALLRLVSVGDDTGLDGFRNLYHELAALAERVDGLAPAEG